MSELQTVELNQTIWLRGNADGALLVFNDDGQRQQCCIGVACTAFGLSDSVIRGVGRLDELDHDDLLHAEFQPVLKTEDVPDDEDQDGYERVVDLLDRVYTINDDKVITDDGLRVSLINAELERLHAPFRFILAAGNQARTKQGPVTPSVGDTPT